MYPRAACAHHVYCRRLREGAWHFVLPLLYSRMRTYAPHLALHAIGRPALSVRRLRRDMSCD